MNNSQIAKTILRRKTCQQTTIQTQALLERWNSCNIEQKEQVWMKHCTQSIEHQNLHKKKSQNCHLLTNCWNSWHFKRQNETLESKRSTVLCYSYNELANRRKLNYINFILLTSHPSHFSLSIGFVCRFCLGRAIALFTIHKTTNNAIATICNTKEIYCKIRSHCAHQQLTFLIVYFQKS